MNFKPDFSKPAQEVIFPRKLQKTNQNEIFQSQLCSTSSLSKTSLNVSYTKLSFQENIHNILIQVNKTIGLLCKHSAFLSCQSLVLIYKAFIRPHLKYDFSIHKLMLLSPTIVHTRFNDSRLFLSFFYCCYYHFSLVFLCLILFFAK